MGRLMILSSTVHIPKFNVLYVAILCFLLRGEDILRFVRTSFETYVAGAESFRSKGVPQLIKEFPALYGIQKLINVFTAARRVSVS